MKTKIRLRSWVKTLLIIVLLETILICYLFIYSSRIERIENTEQTENVSVQLINRR